MRCPACRNTLTQKDAAGIRLDVCRGGCGGIWFDRFELKKMDEPREPVGDGVLDIERDESVRVDKAARRKCPRCQELVMMRHYFSVQKEIEIDECPGCGGVWLDHGELRKIRSLFDSEEEKTEAARARFTELFGGEMGRIEAETMEKRRKARKFARLFRFICPSYYIPGKQSWGAF
ncbi:MAG: zf-TFIIB domain-containing protein [Candidatus Eisenbacteria bacterium]